MAWPVEIAPALALAATLLVLAGCSPQPRSVSYFEAHPDRAAMVLAACQAGGRGGVECENAAAGQARAAANARMAIYRKSFR